MSFDAPTLVTSLDSQNYRTQLEENFSLIQEALESVEANLPETVAEAQAATYAQLSALLGDAPPSLDYVMDHAFHFQFAGVLRTTVGAIGTGILIPWACTAVLGYARLGTAPGAAESVSVDWYESGATIFSGVTTWATGQSGVIRTFAPSDPVTELAAGDFVSAQVTEADAAGTAKDLSMVLIVRRA